MYHNELIKYCSRRSFVSEYQGNFKLIHKFEKLSMLSTICDSQLANHSISSTAIFYGESNSQQLTLNYTNFISILPKPISFSRHSAISAGANKPTAILCFSLNDIRWAVPARWDGNCAASTVCSAGCLTLNLNRSQLISLYNSHIICVQIAGSELIILSVCALPSGWIFYSH